jgi:hypothetical protein
MENIQILYNAFIIFMSQNFIHANMRYMCFTENLGVLILIFSFLQIGHYQTGMHPQTLHQALLYQVKEYYNLWMV